LNNLAVIMLHISTDFGCQMNYSVHNSESCGTKISLLAISSNNIPHTQNYLNKIIGKKESDSTILNSKICERGSTMRSRLCRFYKKLRAILAVLKPSFNFLHHPNMIDKLLNKKQNAMAAIRI